MLPMPKYAFLLPAYKVNYLESAIHSIISQTYSNLRLIISDDCSPADIRGVYERYSSDPRISYRRNESNIGAESLVDHWNLLLNQCDSEYVIVASDDDVYAPDFLSEVDKMVCAYPEVDLFHVRANVIDENGTIQSEDPLSAPFLFSFYALGVCFGR